jgi:hypothetical protein
MLRGIGARRQLAIDGGSGQQIGVVDHALHRRLDRFDTLRQLADFVLAVDIELES